MNVLLVSFSSLIINTFLGKWRTNYKKMTLMWWILIHASIPVLIPLRIWLDTPKIWIPLFIGSAILGQFLGSKLLANNTKQNQATKYDNVNYILLRNGKHRKNS